MAREFVNPKRTVAEQIHRRTNRERNKSIKTGKTISFGLPHVNLSIPPRKDTHSREFEVGLFEVCSQNEETL
jgi:hypothetical protein